LCLLLFGEPMPKPYSYDLRQKVIGAIQMDGMRKGEASIIFSISRNTIDLWLKRQAETGDYQAKSTQPRRDGGKITDWEKFRVFAKAHGDKTQAEMAQLWEGPISRRTISRALQKIDFTRKKKLMATESAMKPNAKRSWSSYPRSHRRALSTLMSLGWIVETIMPMAGMSEVSAFML
jgi:transposase